ncbi:MAG: hypothetical protein HC900_01535 [Methylacidiphilales bacterium]|nr:hypothetical protein [Candidatus Methylacidiphilales bacterium]
MARVVKTKQTDIARALKGVIAAGWPRERIVGVKTTPDGVTVLFGEPKAAQAEPINEWDEVLK